MRGKLWLDDTQYRQVRIIPAHAGQTPFCPLTATRAPDHPRACGANFARSSSEGCAFGSSPRMRGKLGAIQPQRVRARIIPAHAGQTRSASSKNGSVTDHPRACGANSRWSIPAPATNGSSPRMRGKRQRHSTRFNNVRIIPAHAGQTKTAPQGKSTQTDHPRACGANVYVSVPDWAAAGSSPRMRGKRLRPYKIIGRTRIIPAHAGQTAHPKKIRTTRTDHPRACGANRPSRLEGFCCSGSSPRMRGKRRTVQSRYTVFRIIPAHAGQTTLRRPQLWRLPDHPRACGANRRPRPTPRGLRGSSPRMRGKPPNNLRPCSRHPDHPRACGANRLLPVEFGRGGGSSPRMRGKRCAWRF